MLESVDPPQIVKNTIEANQVKEPRDSGGENQRL